MNAARLPLLALTLGLLAGCQAHRHDPGTAGEVLVIDLKSGLG